jgi:hypothetical protein
MFQSVLQRLREAKEQGERWPAIIVALAFGFVVSYFLLPLIQTALEGRFGDYTHFIVSALEQPIHFVVIPVVAFLTYPFFVYITVRAFQLMITAGLLIGLVLFILSQSGRMSNVMHRCNELHDEAFCTLFLVK